jgi:hypothetical protein
MAGLTKPSEIFLERVLPAYQEGVAAPTSERHANIAAKAVSDQIEWTYQFYEQEDPTRLNGARSLKEFREQLFDRCFWLKVLWDTADADKHRFLTRSNTTRLIDSSTAAYSGTGNVLLLGGSAFLPMLEAAVDFWRNWQD